jgi:hypothetical protein
MRKSDEPFDNNAARRLIVRNRITAFRSTEPFEAIRPEGQKCGKSPLPQPERSERPFSVDSGREALEPTYNSRSFGRQ